MGMEVCRRLRAEKNQVAILMLTARDDDIDKILGLEMGADDYMTKPFNPRELVARVKAVLRRSSAGWPSGRRVAIAWATWASTRPAARSTARGAPGSAHPGV